MTFLGWNIIMESPDMIGFGSNEKGSVWFLSKQKDTNNDYDGVGMNHLGIEVDTKESVDKVTEYLKERGIAPLFGTPRMRPEFSGDKGTYYQVMFESPDKVLFEVVFVSFG